MPSFSVTRLIHFCYGHRLLHYSGKCKDLHGHNGLIEIAIEAKGLDRLGMIMDFEQIKTKVQRWVDSELDHRLLLNDADPIIPALRKFNQPIVTMKGNPTAENIAKLVFDYARKQRLPVAAVRLWETRNSFAEYQS